MKILWICPFFLHPTDRGAQIRSLGTLKELHKRHEIHFVALNDGRNTEGPQRSVEYSSRHIAVEHSAPHRTSLGILPQILSSVTDSKPLAVSRYYSAALMSEIEKLIASEHYDCIVCDFLAAAPNVPDISRCVLFQHNVETTIWQRHAEQSKSFLRRRFFAMQASKMHAYEADVCTAAKHVIAVSDIDAQRMKEMFGIQHVTSVPTGVDVDFFAPSGEPPSTSDLVFCGSMDWLPNVDAVEYFIAEILPLIREAVPNASFTIAGRAPDARVFRAAEGVPGITITGKVPDMREYLWGAKISVVPIRIAGGTRLKIYECMAAGLPVVSTTIGAEGLACREGEDILIGDDPRSFAAACIQLLKDDGRREAISRTALDRVKNGFSWSAVSRDFESILESNRLLFT